MKLKLLLFPGSMPPTTIGGKTIGYAMYGGVYFAGPYTQERYEKSIRPLIEKALKKGEAGIERPFVVEVEYLTL